MRSVLHSALGLACLAGAFHALTFAEQKRPGALKVFLGRTCPETAESSRLLAVRYLPGRRYYFNDHLVGESQLRQLIRQGSERRIEKLVWMVADRRLTFGEVASLVSKLQADTPSLHIAVATEAQVGPVEPLEIERTQGRRPDGTFLGVMPCVYSELLPWRVVRAFSLGGEVRANADRVWALKLNEMMAGMETGSNVYRIVLTCSGILPEEGPQGAIDVSEEFTHRPWHRNVRCEWDGLLLVLSAENDYDEDGKALLDEFSDAIYANIHGIGQGSIRVRSINALPQNGQVDV